MSTSATLMLVVGALIIWGGLIASITNAVIKSKKNR